MSDTTTLLIAVVIVCFIFFLLGYQAGQEKAAKKYNDAIESMERMCASIESLAYPIHLVPDPEWINEDYDRADLV